MMKLMQVSKAMLVAAIMVSAPVGAAPILSEAEAFNFVAGGGEVAQFTGAAEAPLFSNMRLNGSQHHTVAFLGDDNSILIGHYARGQWSKNEYLRSWQNGGRDGGKDFLPPVETIAGLPEPSTFALLGLGLLALGVLRRRQTNR